MSFRKNLASNYASQLYVVVIGLVFLPFYLTKMGAEAYGLIGFFSVLQTWFNLLDLGLSPTISREAARYHSGAIEAVEFRQLFRALQILFVNVAVIGGGVFLYFSEEISRNWLKTNELAYWDVQRAICTMIASVALRWMGGLYRGLITGAEQLIWISAFNAVFSTLRFLGVIVSMWLWGFTISIFFLHQLAISVLELFVLWCKGYYILPKKNILPARIGWSLYPLKPTLKFSMTIAFTSAASLSIMHADRLIISGILTLGEYAYFTLGVLVAGGILILTTPVGSILMPRMVRLHTEGKHVELISLYRRATRWVAVLVGAASVTILTTADLFLYAWSGDLKLVSAATPILKLYALGNSLMAMSAFPYYLQYALGNLKYHLIGNIASAIILLPAIYFVANRYGGVGAGYVWLAINIIYFGVWVSVIHRALVPGLHRQWFTRDILSVILPLCFLGVVLNFCDLNIIGRLEAAVTVVLVAVSSLLFGAIFLKEVRGVVFKKLVQR